MDTQNMTREELVRLVTRKVVEALVGALSIPIGVSNHHVHLCREDMDALFGAGSELVRMKDLRQPGQYACEQTVSVRGPKGELRRVRVLGPLRPETQVEISVTDSFTIGVPVPVRESGRLDGTPGVELIGPCGSVKKDAGAIAAMRHIHMTPQDAAKFGLKDRDTVDVDVGDSVRGATLKGVLVRVSDSYALEMHLDVDEANAIGAKNNDYAIIRR